MNKTEILDIVNEPSKHIQIAKIVGEDRIVYSSKFVELLELIPTMLTKADVVAMLTEIQLEIEEKRNSTHAGNNEMLIGVLLGIDDCSELIQQKINELKAESEG